MISRRRRIISDSTEDEDIDARPSSSQASEHECELDETTEAATLDETSQNTSQLSMKSTDVLTSDEFHIPLSDDEVRKEFHQIDSDDVESELNKFEKKMHKESIYYIIENKRGSVFYAILTQMDEIGSHLLVRAYEILYQRLNELIELCKNIHEYVTRTGRVNIDDDKRKCTRQAVQMIVWFVCRIAQAINNRSIDAQKKISPVRGRGKKVKTSNIFTDINWSLKRQNLTRALIRLLRLNDSVEFCDNNLPSASRGPLKLLWCPPMIDARFVGEILTCCSSLLADPDIVKSAGIEAFAIIFHVFGVLSHHYGQARGVAERICIMLRDNEHIGHRQGDLTSPAAEAIHEAILLTGCTELLDAIFDRINNLSTSDFAKEGCAKAFAAFLTTITHTRVEHVQKRLSIIEGLLEIDQYMIRIAVLTCYTDIIINRLSGEQLDEKDRKTRDSMLASLQDHIHDKNAYVRQKSILNWARLVEELAMPLKSYHNNVVGTIADRLQDKSSMVRKACVHFLDEVLQRNPFASNFDDKYWRDEVERVRKELAHAREKHENEQMTKGFEDFKKFIDVSVYDLLALKHDPEDCDNDIERNARIESREYFQSTELFARMHKCLDNFIRCQTNRRARDRLESTEKSKQSENDDVDIKEDIKPLVPTIAKLDEPFTEDMFKSSTEMQTEALNFITLLETSQIDAALCRAIVWTIEQHQLTTVDDRLDSRGRDLFIFTVAPTLFEAFLFGRQTRDRASIDFQAVRTDEQQAIDIEDEQTRTIKLLELSLDQKIGGEKFAMQLKEVLPTIIKLFHSSTSGDVIEAIGFVVTCKMFGVPGADDGIKSMCNLVWSDGDRSIIKEVVKSFHALYFNVYNDNLNEDDCACQIVRNLIALANTDDASYLASLEKLIIELQLDNKIDNRMMHYLWYYFGSRPENAIPAIQIIGYIARADAKCITNNIKLLKDYGFKSERFATDLTFARHVLYAFQMAMKKIDITTDEGVRKATIRLPGSDSDIQRICAVLIDRLADPTSFNSTDYAPFAEMAIDFIYKMTNEPHTLVENILADTFKHVKENLKIVSSTVLMNRDENEICAVVQNGCHPVSRDVMQKMIIDRDVILTRFLTILGHVAMKTILLLDESGDYQKEMARREMYKNKFGDEEPLAIMSPSQRRQKEKKKQVTQRLTSRRNSNNDEDNAMMGGTTEEDYLLERVERIYEEELLPTGCLGKYATIFEYIIKNDGYFGANVNAAATLALSKFMLISQSYARQNIQRFITLFCRSKHPIVRGNLMLAAGDLFFRWPNVTEPFSRELYECLNDHIKCQRRDVNRVADAFVRQNCIMVLTHLLLNDMVMPKKYVSEVALATLDLNPKVAALAKEFFKQMATKTDNKLYNLMSDVISRLSKAAVVEELLPHGGHFTEEKFETVMKFLLAFISKEKNCEHLLDKMCARIKETEQSTDDQLTADENERQKAQQCRQFAFCLANLSVVGEKAFNKFMEKFEDNSQESIIKSLADPVVFNRFKMVLALAKKSARYQNTKDRIDDAHNLIARLHEAGANDEQAIAEARRIMREEEEMHKTKSPKSKNAQRQKNAGTSQRRKRSIKDSTQHTLDVEQQIGYDDDDGEATLHEKHRKRRHVSIDKKTPSCSTGDSSESLSQSGRDQTKKNGLSRRLLSISEDE